MEDFKREDCAICTANGEQLKRPEALQEIEKRGRQTGLFMVVMAAVFLLGQIAAACLKAF